MFQSSELPSHISDDSLQAYLKLKEHLIGYHDPGTFEATTVKWLMILMESTFGTHTELLSSRNGVVTFDSIKREPISGLLSIQLKRERIKSKYRVVLLPRVFESKIKWYVEQLCLGRFQLSNPILMSRSGKALTVSDFNKILQRSFNQLDGIPQAGKNLHAIRDLIAALAIVSGANIQYLAKASGHSNPPLVRKDILPMLVAS